jgi:hypothetical protein
MEGNPLGDRIGPKAMREEGKEDNSRIGRKTGTVSHCGPQSIRSAFQQN